MLVIEMEHGDRLYEFLDDEFDDALRSVGYYGYEETKFVFVRDDVEAEYDTNEFDRVFREA